MLRLMRHIILDTETTGFDPNHDKIVEVGAIELIDYRPKATFHAYYNPGIPVPAAATDVHGLTDEFLAGFPPFAPDPLLTFLADSPIVAHNAAFDMGFINAACGPLPNEIIDSLALARRKHPGAPCTLDALCRRYKISTAHRTKHGALLDAQLLAEVYIELIGRQDALDLAVATATATAATLPTCRPAPLPARLTAADLAAHAAMLQDMPRHFW